MMLPEHPDGPQKVKGYSADPFHEGQNTASDSKLVYHQRQKGQGAKIPDRASLVDLSVGSLVTMFLLPSLGLPLSFPLFSLFELKT